MGKRSDTSSILPFALDALSRESLTNQLVDRIRKAVDDGTYCQGDRLPTWRQMAEALGVSVRVPREAMRLLQKAGYVVARPRIGCVVAKPVGEKRWKGVVAAVCYEADEVAYYMNSMLGEMRRRLARAGYLLVPVTVRKSEDNRFDFAAARLFLGFKVDLAVVFCNHVRVLRWIDELGVPLVAPDSYGKLAHCVGTVPNTSLETALDAFARHCRTAKIRRVLEVGFCLSPTFSVRKVLEPLGVSVEKWRIPPLDDRVHRDGVRDAAKDAFLRRFGRKRENLPDLIVLTDDILATGAFLALEHLRIEIPRDVRVVTLANEGDLPVSILDPTCFLNRPAVRGAALSRYVIDLLGGNTSAQMPLVEFAYKIGQTFPAV